MSAVPKGRTRWSSQWVMWGLVPAGLNISDKSCDFTLVFWWRSSLPLVLWPSCFPLTKKGVVFPPLLLGCWPPARGSVTSLFSLHPTSKPPDRPPDLSSVSSQVAFPILSGHILGNLYLFKTVFLFPKPGAAFPPSHTLAMLSAAKCTNKGLSQCQVGPQMSHLSERQAAEFCLRCSKGPCCWISMGYVDLAVRWCAGEKDVWLVCCCFELEEKMARSLH